MPGVGVDVAEALQPVQRDGHELAAGDDADARVPELEQRAGRLPRAAAVVRRHDVALQLVASDERHPPAARAVRVELRTHARVVLRIRAPAAGQDQRADPLGAQERDVRQLALRLRADVADRHEAPGRAGHAEDRGRDLREVRVVDVEGKHADRLRVLPHERLGMRVGDVVELLRSLEHPRAQRLGDPRPCPVQDARRRCG
jgi:hypothetical protein